MMDKNSTFQLQWERDTRWSFRKVGPHYSDTRLEVHSSLWGPCLKHTAGTCKWVQAPDVLVTAETIINLQRCCTDLCACTPDAIFCESPVPRHNKACCFFSNLTNVTRKQKWVDVESLEKPSVSPADQDWLAIRFKSLQISQFEHHVWMIWF